MFSGRLHWGTKQLVVDDLDLLNQLSKPYLSPSTAASLAGCPARWALDRLVPSKPDPYSPAETGSAVHRAFEVLYSLDPPARTFDAAWEAAQKAAPTTGDVDGWLTNVRAMVEGLWKIEAPPNVHVAEVEMRVESEVAGIPFFGFIDRLDDGPEGVVIIDYKTGKLHRGGPNDTHGDQLRLYSEALRHLGINASLARLYYVAHGEVVRVDLSANRVARTVQEFKKSWEVLQRIATTHTLPCVPSPLCGWCPAITMCPTGAASRWPHSKTTEAETAGAWLQIGVGRSAAPVATKVKEDEMTERVYVDDKPWIEIDDTGRYNLNSYAAVAAFGMAALAVDTLQRNHLPIQHEAILSMAYGLADAVEWVAGRIRATPSLQGGTHTRIRGALRSIIEITPAPEPGAGRNAWDEWFRTLAQRTFVVTAVAVELLAADHDHGHVPAAELSASCREAAA